MSTLPAPAFSGGCFGYYSAFDEENAVVTVNGGDVGGRVFTRTYDPEPDDLFVLAGDKMYLVKMHGAFMQSFGMSSVFDVTVHNMDLTASPVTIDYEVAGPVPDAVLEQPENNVYAFTAGADRYEVRLAGPIVRDPAMFVNLRGRLTVKTERKGSKSEGPEYYLVPDKGKKVHVLKNASLWEEDPALQNVVDSEVWISGAMVDGELVYKDIHLNER